LGCVSISHRTHDVEVHVVKRALALDLETFLQKLLYVPLPTMRVQNNKADIRKILNHATVNEIRCYLDFSFWSNGLMCYQGHLSMEQV